ncbi:methyltransferase domain-containing protein [Pseudomonadota bacterium]
MGEGLSWPLIINLHYLYAQRYRSVLRYEGGFVRKIDYSDHEYHKQRHPEFLDNDELYSAWSEFSLFAYFNGIESNSKVLEVGGGFGYNLYKVASMTKVCLLEPSDMARKMAECKGLRTVSSFDELGDEKFDFILCRHVIEHVQDPLELLTKMLSVTSQNGKLKLIVPVERNDMPVNPNDIDHHLFCWNPQALANLAYEAGWNYDKHYWEYYGGRRKLLALYRKFGGEVYAKSVRFVGKAFRYRELVMDLSA